MTFSDYPRTADFSTAMADSALQQLLGFVVESADAGRTVLRFAARPEFMIPGGVVQGGIQAAFIDSGMMFAVRTLVPATERFTTAELSVNYLRPAVGAFFVCESEVVRKGRTLVYVESSLKDDRGRLVARASSSLVRAPDPPGTRTDDDGRTDGHHGSGPPA